MADHTDAFLSHNWGNDENDRDNHQCVSLINEELKARGYKTWFDEENLAGNIEVEMAQGIEQSEGVIVFITRKYYEKVNGNKAGDNCQKEFRYASKIKTRAKMVPVVMEEFKRLATPWKGLVGINLGGEMYVDISGNIENKTYLSQKIELLLTQLLAKGIQPMRGKFNSLSRNMTVKNSSFSAKYSIKHFGVLILLVSDGPSKYLLTICVLVRKLSNSYDHFLMLSEFSELLGEAFLISFNSPNLIFQWG